MSWWLVTFSRRGAARYVSHLDTARALQRTFARAGVTLALSAGMRPKPRLSLPLPLPVGAAAGAELAVAGIVDGEGTIDLRGALRALRAAGAGGLRVEDLTVVGERPRPRPVEAAYSCRLDGDPRALGRAVREVAAAAEMMVDRTSPKGTRRLDLKRYLRELAAEPQGDGVRLTFALGIEREGTARPGSA